MKLLRSTCAALACWVALGVAHADDFKLKIIAFNDFHGNLESPGKIRANAQSPEVDAGGADFFAGYIEHLKSQNPYNVVVSAGDLIGAAPLVSSLFHDEGTIEVMNRLGLEISGVGNHEFDKGSQELLRMQRGGCSRLDQDTCKGAAAGTPIPFEGAKFKFLAANVFETSTGKTLFPGYAIKTYKGVKVAFIGLTLKGTPEVESTSSVAGLRFADEASTINGIVRQLGRQGIRSFVVLIHQGGAQTTKGIVDINACDGGLSGSPIESIVDKLDDAVDLVISAHTHEAYICQLPNRAGRKVVVTSAASYGRLLSDIDITIDTKTKEVKSVVARNIVVDRTDTNGIKPDTLIKRIVDKYAVLAAPITDREVGSVREDITRTRNAAGESALGELIADSQLQATRASDAGGAVVAFMNPGGIRADVRFASGAPGVANGEVTYGAVFEVQPFGDNLVSMNVTGTQIKTLLEEQFEGCALGAPTIDTAPPSEDRMLQVSEGFSYEWSATGAICNKVDSSSIKINGVAIIPSAKYRVTVNSFLAEGGDQFYVLKAGAGRLGGPLNLEAMIAYFANHQSVAAAQPHRVTVNP